MSGPHLGCMEGCFEDGVAVYGTTTGCRYYGVVYLTTEGLNAYICAA